MLEAPRRRPLNHRRTVTYESFEREDGLFDIEASVYDTKGHIYSDRERGQLKPGEPVHDIRARLTINDCYVVIDFATEMAAVPFAYCRGAVDPQRLVGCCIVRGWRKAVDQAFGPRRGCTHLRDLVLGMGTVAFQTLSANTDEKRFTAGLTDSDVVEKPSFLGGCHSWAISSPVVKSFFPQFYEPED
ncbi:DUF2889 domain-containing protein [Chelatococcus asaccharovorans]|uniref:DUF2889 family protein n=1 Tax=Chelatococcus asaccharovorans TaxID=28210 RepID=A0A2V3TQY0_9HYPH|nr:DUF2889 domain-containing protein [Chelatococcus asaccharovorans]MBS7707839.1 DUF2889 domain-containing protein [Chelatococcus asaccharovorans]PXW50914.1 hypothetical protein C7450_12225 [Chelatococcus asaccharovorans]